MAMIPPPPQKRIEKPKTKPVYTIYVQDNENGELREKKTFFSKDEAFLFHNKVYGRYGTINYTITALETTTTKLPW